MTNRSKEILGKKINEIFMLDRRVPSIVRVIEGMTNTMCFGYWCAGGILQSPLSYAYILQWFTSMNQQIRPSYHNFLIQIHFIDLVVMERLFAIYGSYWMCIFYLSSMWMNAINPNITFVKVISMVILTFMTGKTSWQHCVSFIVGAIFYLWSNHCLYYSMMDQKVFAQIGFHMSMSVASYLEKPIYCYDQSFTTVDVLMFLLHFYQTLQYL